MTTSDCESAEALGTGGGKPMTALVTGVTGFIGSHLVQRLADDDWAVHALTRRETVLGRRQTQPNRARVHSHDGTTEHLIEILEKVRPKVVFHLASLFIAEHKPQDVEPLIRSNVLFGVQLLEAMRQAGVECLVNTGTSWQHFENHNYSPVCLYAATKQAFESVLQFYCETTKVKAVSLRLFDTYGPNDQRKKLFYLLDKAAREKTPLLMSPGEQLLDLVYIDDVIDAFLDAASHLDNIPVGGHEIYAVTSNKPVRLRALVELYSRLSGLALPIEWGGRPYRAREVMVPWNTGQTLPGWRPKIDLATGIARLLASRSQERSQPYV